MSERSFQSSIVRQQNFSGSKVGSIDIEIDPTLTAVSTIDEMAYEAVRRKAREIDRRFRYELATNDWEQYPIIDIVQSVEHGFSLDRGSSLETYRYESPAPRFEDCDYPPRSRIWRITEPLYEKLLWEFDGWRSVTDACRQE